MRKIMAMASGRIFKNKLLGKMLEGEVTTIENIDYADFSVSDIEREVEWIAAYFSGMDAGSPGDVIRSSGRLFKTQSREITRLEYYIEALLDAITRTIKQMESAKEDLRGVAALSRNIVKGVRR